MVGALDEEALWKFAHLCGRAVMLLEGNYTLLALLNEETIQHTVARRLKEPLYTEWIKEKQQYIQSRFKA